MKIKQTERNYSLDFLKIVATICIVFHHYQQITGARWETGINFFGSWFYWGCLVEFFFILSGYFMLRYVEVLRNGTVSLKQWYVKRAKRLLPVMATSVVVYNLALVFHNKVYGFAYNNETINVWGSIIAMLGVQEGWVFKNPAINNPIWYISVLLLCYIVFYLAIQLSKKLECSPFYIFAGLILLGCAIQTYSLALPFLNDQASRGYICFFWGLFLARFIRDFGVNKKVVWLSLITLFACLGLFMFYSHFIRQGDIVYILVFFLFPSIILLFETKAMHHLFRHSFWGLWSKISFDTYIWHLVLAPIIYAILQLLNVNVNVNTVGCMIVYTVIAELVGVLSYYKLELPLNRKVDQFLSNFKSLN